MRNQHVVPHSSGWAVKTSGSNKSTKVYTKQSQAIRSAQKIARNNKSELFIHGRDGRIRERNSYSKDYNPPKG